MKKPTLDHIVKMMNEKYNTLSDLSRDSVEDAYDRFDRTLASATLCLQLFTSQPRKDKDGDGDGDGGADGDSVTVQSTLELIWSSKTRASRAPIRRAFYDLIAQSHVDHLQAIPYPLASKALLEMLKEESSMNMPSVVAAFLRLVPFVFSQAVETEDGTFVKGVAISLSSLLKSANLPRALVKASPQILVALTSTAKARVFIDQIVAESVNESVNGSVNDESVNDVSVNTSVNDKSVNGSVNEGVFFSEFIASLWSGVINDDSATAYAECMRHILSVYDGVEYERLRTHFMRTHCLNTLKQSITRLAAIKSPTDLTSNARRRRLVRAKLCMKAFESLGMILQNHDEIWHEIVCETFTNLIAMCRDVTPNAAYDISDAILLFVSATQWHALHQHTFEASFRSFLSTMSLPMLSMCSKLGLDCAPSHFLVEQLLPAFELALHRHNAAIGNEELLGLVSLLPSPLPKESIEPFISIINQVDLDVLVLFSSKVLSSPNAPKPCAHFEQLVTAILQRFASCSAVEAHSFTRVFASLSPCWTEILTALEPFVIAAAKPLLQCHSQQSLHAYTLSCARANAVLEALKSIYADDIPDDIVFRCFFLQFAAGVAMDDAITATPAITAPSPSPSPSSSSISLQSNGTKTSNGTNDKAGSTGVVDDATALPIEITTLVNTAQAVFTSRLPLSTQLLDRLADELRQQITFQNRVSTSQLDQELSSGTNAAPSPSPSPLDAELWSHYVQALDAISHEHTSVCFPSARTYALIPTSMQLYFARDAVLYAIELAPDLPANAFALLYALEYRLEHEVEQAPEQSSGAFAARDMVQFWRRRSKVNGEMVALAVEELTHRAGQHPAHFRALVALSELAVQTSQTKVVVNLMKIWALEKVFRVDH